MKGSAATIGADALAALAERVERSIRDGTAATAVAESLSELGSAVDELVGELRRKLTAPPPEPATAAPTRADRERASEVSRQLATLLADSDVHICAGVPSNRRPHPAVNSVSPQKSTGPPPNSPKSAM